MDPDARSVEVWTPDSAFPTVERERFTWLPDGAAEPLVVELEALFKAI